MKNDRAIIPGSVSAIAAQSGKSIAETFLSVDAIILVDISGSMETHDARGGESRYTIACAELAKLQATLPGKLALIAFASHPVFTPSGIPPAPTGTTDLAGALRFAKVADTGDMRFIVISDGEPNSEQDALAVAAQYKGRIDTVYVGPEGGEGQAFLQRLAKRQAGQSVTAAHANTLCAVTEQLLLAAINSTL